MVSVAQPFFTGPAAMSFSSQQQDEQERYARYWSQFATYPPSSQPAAPAIHVPAVVPSQAWSGDDEYSSSIPHFPQASFFEEPQSFYPQPDFLMPPTSAASLPVSSVPSYQSSPSIAFSSPQIPFTAEPVTASSSSSHAHKHARTFSHDSYVSFTSTQARSPDASESGFSRSSSPSNADMNQYGYLNAQGTWSCNYPGCTSRAVFTRGCDLRKHHKRHTKSFFCRYPGCSQSTGGGFSSKKDLARHEAKHNPGVVCEWDGCDRVFSRVDNMRDHVKRIHLKGAKRAAAVRHASNSSQSSTKMT
ncbi:uncharacterized protein PV09_08100 [Verruconis gallopava]|uniref:C2H2-type domain-containing protein n=1 Tax=Verruconis gallopava TaxID=253628 RepID=A0A0D1XDW4_9PEZI|nr:uncharacterized protein PV09_08100 [Verruconis gallopava]KIW00391.1 hypothetical protein PV09_08100 [Verruconis gallopava]